VGGRFELLDRLGAGGMGTVWRARDLGLDREVAIKEVRPPDAAVYEHDPGLAAQQRERVLRESRALARLQHPNVVSIYQILEIEGSPFPWIVMELVRGSSLADRLRQGAMAPQEVARLGRDVLAALRAAHAAGILHRDVKPGNVLLRQDGGAVLTDFGIAAMHDSTTLTATGEVIGSPEYIAPERLHGDETRTASDLWSLAMLLYVAVEGYHPMRRASTMATLAAVMTEPVPPPRRAGPLGPALAAVLVADHATRPNGEQLDRMLAAAETGVAPGPSSSQPYQQFPPPVTPPHGAPAHGTAAYGTSAHGTPAHGTPAHGTPSHGTPAHGTPPHGAPAFGAPTPYGGPPSSPHTPAPAGRKRAILTAGLAALAAIVTAVAITLYVTRDSSKDPGDDTAAGNSGSTSTQVATVPNITVPSVNVPTVPQTGGGSAPEDLHTPEGARAAVAALTDVMGGSKVSELGIYSDYAVATAPTDKVKDGFDNFEYRNGVATRTGADSVSDDAVVDLNAVSWDAMPALWNRAEKELGVDDPTLSYLIITTDLFDGTTPVMMFYMVDEYGAAYLKASFAGKVLEVYARDS
jgi:serine/threonine protein kinase